MKRSLTLITVVAMLGVAPPVASGAVRLPGFRSPSRNIKCLYVPGPPATLLCSIARADYAAQLQARCMAPNGAGVDWHGFTLGPSRKGEISCSGGILYNPDTQHPSYVTLAYGKSWRESAFTCTSRVSGVTCSNRHGHGLFISRRSWRAW